MRLCPVGRVTLPVMHVDPASAPAMGSWRIPELATRVRSGSELPRRSSRPASIPLSPPPHPLPVPLPETFPAGPPVALVLARLANRFPRSAVSPLQVPPAAILAAPLVRTVLPGADDHFRTPTALYHTRTAVPPAGRFGGLLVARIGLHVAGHDCPGYRSERSRSARGIASE